MPSDTFDGTRRRYTHAEKLLFARKLWDAILASGLKQAEFARRVEANLKKKDKTLRFGRDSLTGYIRGKHAPLPAVLEAMAEVFKMKPTDLFPAYGSPLVREAPSPLEMKQLDDGNVYLRIEQTLDRETALQIIALAGRKK